MSFSGFGEPSTVSVEHTSVAESSILNLDNFLLLCIILGICGIIVVLLLCGLLCMCYKLYCTRKNNLRTHAAYLSKATSITGLHDNGDSNALTARVQLQVVLGKNGSTRSFSDNQCEDFDCGSQPRISDIKNQDEISHKSLTLSPQSKVDDGNHQTTDFTKSLLSDQLRKDDITGVTANMKVLLNTDTSYQDISLSENVPHYVTSPNFHNNIVDVVNSHKCPSFSLPCAAATINSLEIHPSKENIYDCENVIEIDGEEDKVSINSTELSPASTNAAATSLPLDAYGHPRAWFVPLDEIYHEPLRHSYIDVSNEQHPLLNYQQVASNQQAGFFVSKKPFESCDHDEASGFDGNCVVHASKNIRTPGSDGVSPNKTSDSRSAWRDSGIPTSTSNLRSACSSEMDTKKLSLWEQREDRPVVFLESTVGDPVCSVSYE